MALTFEDVEQGYEPNVVYVLFDAMTNAYRKVYHAKTCYHLSGAVISQRTMSLDSAETRHISPCLHCHKTHNREWVCPSCEKYLSVTADPEQPGWTRLLCLEGHIVLRQRPLETKPKATLG